MQAYQLISNMLIPIDQTYIIYNSKIHSNYHTIKADCNNVEMYAKLNGC